jgi:hypothetical protein
MKSLLMVLALTVFSAPAFAQSMPSGHPSTDAKKDGKGAPESPLPQKGKVLSSADAMQYTYIEVQQNKQTLWIAGPAVKVKKGDVIRFDNGMVMKDFVSKSLNRTFPSVTFVSRVVVTNEKE